MFRGVKIHMNVVLQELNTQKLQSGLVTGIWYRHLMTTTGYRLEVNFVLNHLNVH